MCIQIHDENSKDDTLHPSAAVIPYPPPLA